ncbi:MAG: hypothetical protein GXP24_08350 [Planctomycetes bacterium]|nr:hypothetical protein [Planctomycetota bacterium]
MSLTFLANLLRPTRRLVLVAAIWVGLTAATRAGPYAPAAGQIGSMAIDKDDAAIAAWATGWENYAVGSHVDVEWQTPNKALGAAQGTSFDVVSLGRGGEITLTFDRPIRDGAGYDFAVFENGFGDQFLELAYVEVSSNGTDFFRFANDSLTAAAVSTYGTVDTTNVEGLAGKYRQGFGTPFDLAELSGVLSFLDVRQVTHVRILDIVGDGTFFDTSGDILFDPFPTNGSGGFDLDAVGVFNVAAENADFNGDNLVDNGDLAIWEQRFGIMDNAPFQPGDADGDSDVDGRDFLAWQRQLDQGGLSLPPNTVPEPNPLVLLCVSLLAMLPMRHFPGDKG